VTSSFWEQLDGLLETSQLVIDRPAGSRHPRRPAMVYPLDYGYLAGTSGGDGDEVDVWVGSLPDQQLDAVVCTADTHKRDTELKLLLGCTAEEKQMICAFHEAHQMGAMLIEKKDHPDSG